MFLACVSVAGITIEAPPQFSPPLYWSGTNCRLYVSAQATGNDSIARCRLSLSDGTYEVEVFDETYGGPPYRVKREAAYMFDSTFFQCGSYLTVKVEAWTLTNVPYQETYTAPVKNFATLAQLSEFNGDADANGRGIVEAGLQFCNYYCYTGFEYLWTSYDFFQHLAGSNFAYINTHGYENGGLWYLKSDYGWELDEPEAGPPLEEWYTLGHLYPQTAPFNGSSLLDYRTAQMDGDVPPLNANGNPPINIVYNDACSIGISNDYAEGYLYPYTNQYTLPFDCENQASLAWAVSEYIPAKYTCALEFISMLYQCYNIDTTRDWVFYVYAQWCEDNFEACQASSPSDALTVYGDFAAKLRGVYTGNWFDDIDMIPVEDVFMEIEY